MAKDDLTDLQLAETALWHVENEMVPDGAEFLRELVDRMKRRAGEDEEGDPHA